MLRISVIICTYERPALLAAALQSIIALDGLDRADLDIIVVDNSDRCSARPVFDPILRASAVPMTYVEAHPPNISRARNAGIAATTADIVVFLDDDQTVEKTWLLAILDGLARFPHDVLFGSVTPRFEDQGPASAPARAMFTRWITADAGTDLLAFGQPRGPRFALATANSIFRRARTLAMLEPFDEAFGHAGGEDFDLFCRLQRQGRRFGWLPEARASDFVPRHRCAPDYLTKRHYAGGQVYAAGVVRNSAHPRLTHARIFVTAALQAVVLAPRVMVALAQRKAPALDLRLRFAGVRGKLFWRKLHPLYREEKPLQSPLVALGASEPV